MVGGSSEKFYLDDVHVWKLGPPGALFNPGFELGNLIAWNTSNTDPGHPGEVGVDFDVTTDSPHAGDYCAVCTGSNGAILSHINQTVSCLPNHRYTATLWYRTEGVWSGNALDGGIEERKADGTYAGFTHHTPLYANLQTEWGRMTIDFVTGPDTEKLFWDVGMNIYNNDKVFLDDFELVDHGVPVISSTIGDARKAGLYSFVETDAVVTKVVEDPIGGEVEFFAEAADRSAGMLVECPDAYTPYSDFLGAAAPPVGDKVHITATILPAADSGRFNNTLVMSVTAPMTKVESVTPLKPVGTILRPILTGTGAPLDGLYIRCGGMVTASDEIFGWFNINDGSGGDLLVKTSYVWPFPYYGQNVVVNGHIVRDGDTKVHVRQPV